MTFEVSILISFFFPSKSGLINLKLPVPEYWNYCTEHLSRIHLRSYSFHVKLFGELGLVGYSASVTVFIMIKWVAPEKLKSPQLYWKAPH
jgi:hypothetical protein